MNTVVPISNLPATWNPSQLALIKKTVAKDLDRNSKGVDLHLGEFDLAMEICRSLKLDPLRRQIYFFCFAKDDPKRRQMVPVVGIGGYRSIAARTGNYRPSESVPEYVYDKTKIDVRINPKGLVKATETVWQYLHGQWFAVRAEAHWDAYAPIVEEPEDGYRYEETGEAWPDGNPKKKKVPVGKIIRKLDANKDRWRVDPEGMLAKCSESLCLRKAWPDDFAGTYFEGELDHAEVLDLTPTEIIEKAEADAKLDLMGGVNALTVDWLGDKLRRVAEGEFLELALKWLREPGRTRGEADHWWKRNEAARAEYKARHGGEYLEFQKAWEKQEKQLPVEVTLP